MANDFGGDANCVAVWKFDDDANDSKGGNDLTEVNTPTYDSSDKKEGTHSIDFEDSSNECCTIGDGDLDAGFPGKSGTSEQSFSICGWFKVETMPSINRRAFVAKWENGTRSFMVSIEADGKVSFFVGYNNGASYTGIEFDTACSTGKWYHFGVTYDSSDNSMKLRVWDDDAGDLLDDNKEGTVSGDMSPDTAPVEVGRFWGSLYYDGKVDEVVIFKDVLSDSEIDQIRAGTYGAGVTEKSSSDTGTGADAKTGYPAVSQSKIEIGTGADAKASYPTAVLTKSESGAGIDAKGSGYPSAILSGTDLGVGVDAYISLAKLIAKLSSDTGIGVDTKAGYPSVAHERTESGTGFDTKTGYPLVVLVASELGVGVDAYISLAKLIAKLSSDVGSGIDAKANYPSVEHSRSDSGVGADAKESYPSVVLLVADAGVGVDLRVAYSGVVLPRLRYIIEIHETDGSLVAILHEAFNIGYIQVVNAPHVLTFEIKSDDDKLAYVTLGREIWLRNYETDEVVRKFRLQTQEDVRE